MSTILVTGASGYLASWIVEWLLRTGHTVHATVRNLRDTAKYSHLEDVAKDLPGNLRLFSADLLQEGSFSQSMEDCEIVIHTASPYFLTRSKDPENELIRPAVDGTKNILNSVNATPSVRRVVLTSSIVTLYNDAVDVYPHTIEESGENGNTDPHYNSYAYSKTLAEKTALQMQKIQSHWDLITIHPWAIFGPSLSKRIDATSIGMMRDFLKGSFRSGVPKLTLGFVDIRDVAEAHIRAALNPIAQGKYLVVAESLTLLDIAGRMDLQEKDIPDKLPKSEVPKWLMWLMGPFIWMQRSYVARNVGYPIVFNAKRIARELGQAYRKPEVTLNDHILQLASDGLI